MIRFGIKEYVRNLGHNLCIILILLVMITSAALISNLDQENRVHRLADRYMDDDSLFLSYVYNDWKEELSHIDGEVHVAEIIAGCYDINIPTGIGAVVYTEETMELFAPRLSSGVYPDEIKTDDDTLCVLMSENPFGIEAGDTFTYYIIGDEVDEYIPVKVYVAGIMSEGQRLYIEQGEVFTDMIYEDFFQIYSYEQTEEVRMIFPEKEMEKMPEVRTLSQYTNVMINPNDDLTEEEKNTLRTKIISYEEEHQGIGIYSVYPDPADLEERSELKHKSILLKYEPLFLIVVVLFSISIVGIIMIKTAKSTRYYGIMYAYGMRYHTAQFITGFEMAFNCLMAFLGTVSLLNLQNTFAIVGKINCNLDSLELLVLLAICLITVMSSILTTRSVLKEKTPVEILKNRD